MNTKTTWTYEEVMANNALDIAGGRLLRKNDRLKGDLAINKILQATKGLQTVTCDCRKGSNELYNRGSLVECCLDNITTGNPNPVKSPKGVKDLTLTRQFLDLPRGNYEVKFMTGYANASPITNKHITKKCLLVTLTGVYICLSTNLVLNGSGHVSTKSIANATRLEKLSELLGL